MSFQPKATFLVGPTPDYFYLNDLPYLAKLEAPEDVMSYPFSSSFTDCSGAVEWPDAYLGNKAGVGRLYAYETDTLFSQQFPILAEKRLVTYTEGQDNIDTISVWAMNGDLPAGCEAVSSTSFTKLYHTMWGDQSAFCAKETDDYVFVRDDFYPDPVHRSYIDFYRVHDGVESDRVSAIRSSTFDSMTIPPYRTTYDVAYGQYGNYTFLIQTFYEPGQQETAYINLQFSQNSSFSTIYAEYTYQASTYWDGEGNYLYTRVSIPNITLKEVMYARAKRIDKLNGVVVRDSGWSSTWTIDQNSRSDGYSLNGTPGLTPYLVYRTYNENTGIGQKWSVGIYGQQGGADQEPDIVRIQVSATADFATTIYNTTHELTYGVDGWGNNWGTEIFQLSQGTKYARCRYESSDGSVVGPWSTVFEMNGDNPVNQSNYYYFAGYQLVGETNWSGEKAVYIIASNALHKNGHSYVLLFKKRFVYEAQLNTYSHEYGSLYLADYDGDTVILTLVESELEDWFASNMGYLYTLVEFGGKLYAGWDSPAGNDVYSWCDVTDSVIGEVQHVAYPAGIEYPYVVWSTLAVVHGDLRVVCSLDDSSSYIMGIASILSDDPTMKAYSNIKTGYYFAKDIWLESLWFGYENYSSDETGICWLGTAAVSNAIWFVNSI